MISQHKTFVNSITFLLIEKLETAKSENIVVDIFFYGVISDNVNVTPKLKCLSLENI